MTLTQNLCFLETNLLIFKPIFCFNNPGLKMSLVSSTAFKPVSTSLPSLVGHAEKLLSEPSLTTEQQQELVRVTEEAFKAAKSKLGESVHSDTELSIKAILLHGRALLVINKIN